jgi:ATP-binding protein involved in chromosome partitioning
VVVSTPQDVSLKIARELDVDFIGKVPLDPTVVDCGDDGRPLLRAAPDSPAAAAYRNIATTLAGTGGDVAGIATPFAWTVAEGVGKPSPAHRGC